MGQWSINVGSYNGRRWPYGMKRAFARAERRAGRPVIDLDRAACDELRASGIELRKWLDDSLASNWGNLYEAEQLAGYIEGLEHFLRGDHWETVFKTLPLVSGRFMNGGHYLEIGTDPVASNCFYILGQENLRFGNFSDAAELFHYGVMIGKHRKQAQIAACMTALCLYRTEDSSAIEAYDAIIEELLPYDEHLRTVHRLCHPRARLHRLGDPVSTICESLRNFSRWDTTTAVLVAEDVVRNLLEQGRAPDAEVVLKELSHLTFPHAWATALMHQLRSVVKLNNAQYHEAIADGNECLRIVRQQRLQSCGPELRKTMWWRYSSSRSAVLDSHVALGNCLGLAAFLESERLRARVDATVEVEDEVCANATTTEEARASSRTEKSAGSIPSAFLKAWGDLFRAYSMTAMDTETVDIENAAVSDDELWFAVARYGQRIYWTATTFGEPLGCGSIELSHDLELAEALDQFAKAYGSQNAGSPTADVPVFPTVDFDFVYSDWGSAEESLLSGALGRLIPAAVSARMEILGPNTTLALCIGEGIPPLPWPVVRISTGAGKQRALIEMVRLRHWLSKRLSRLADSDPILSDLGRDLPLLVVVDNPTGDLRGQSPEGFSKAKHCFSGGEPFYNLLKSEDAFLSLMRDECRDNPLGVFFYRGHLEAGVDPASALLHLPTYDSDSDEWGSLRAGEMFGTLPDGTAWMPLPSRTVLSCCSSSATGLLGGEAIGLAAACLGGGGTSEVIATAIDVSDCSFTSAFDSLLISVAQGPAHMHESLSDLQRRMYSEWRIYSLRGGTVGVEDIDYPHPLVWAMYQAY